MPPAIVQRRLLKEADCDVLLEEGTPDAEAQRRLSRFLQPLGSGDEVLVHGLDVFQRPTGQLAKLLRDLLERGATLRILGEAPENALIEPSEQAVKLLCLLTEHEIRRAIHPSHAASPGVRSGGHKGLTKHQIQHARKLYKDGSSLRSIGFLFQVSPNEVWKAIGD